MQSSLVDLEVIFKPDISKRKRKAQLAGVPALLILRLKALEEDRYLMGRSMRLLSSCLPLPQKPERH